MPPEIAEIMEMLAAALHRLDLAGEDLVAAYVQHALDLLVQTAV